MKTITKSQHLDRGAHVSFGSARHALAFMLVWLFALSAYAQDTTPPSFISSPPLETDQGSEYKYIPIAVDEGSGVTNVSAPLLPSWLTFENQVNTLASDFNLPSGIAVDRDGNVYIGGFADNRIWKISFFGELIPYAGTGTAGSADGLASEATFNQPYGVAADSDGNLYVADFGNHKIRKIDTDGNVTTLAGSGTAGSTNDIGTSASFNAPYGVATDASGNVYVADGNNHKIRKVTPEGEVSDFAGSGAAGGADGTGTEASFNAPFGVAVDIENNVYVSEFVGQRIRKIAPEGVVSTVAGSGSVGTTNANGTAASFNHPLGLTVDIAGNIYVTDALNNRIRRIDPTNEVTTYTGSTAGSLDGALNTATFSTPVGVAVHPSGDLYVVEQGNNKARRISKVLSGTASVGGGDYDVHLSAMDAQGNIQDQLFTITVNDVTPPTVTIVGPTSITSDEDTFISIVFSEPMTGFDENDLTLSNATVSSFTTSNQTTWIVQLTAIEYGEIVVEINDGVATDLAGNENGETPSYSRKYERASKIMVVADGIFSFQTDKEGDYDFAKRQYHFNSNSQIPYGNLYQASDGSIWGMTYETDSYGAIFKLNEDKLGVTFVHFFSQHDGTYPKGTLIEYNGAVWGTTPSGGQNNYGTLFRIGLDGNDFQKVHDFDNSNGREPGSNLVVYDNKLFGMTTEGGDGGGVIFTLDETEDFDVIYNFDEGYPYGGLIEVNGRLWGLNSYGPNNGYGELFSLNPDGSDYQVYHDFEYSSTDGGESYGDLVVYDGRLWGMTSQGGANDVGTIFSILLDGTDYQVNHHFDGPNGSEPKGSLIVSNEKLWGMTSVADGAFGTIFSYEPDGEGHVVRHTFDGISGNYPEGSLIEIDGELMGMTPFGGTYDLGNIFQISNDGSNFMKLYDMEPWLARQRGELIESNGKLWGMTADGGVLDDGTIYCMDLDGKNVKIVHTFRSDDSNGHTPRGGLIEKNGKLYGITHEGGDNSWGVLFSTELDGTGYTKLFDFPSASFQLHFSALFIYNDKFYGIRNRNEIFSINDDGTGFMIETTLPNDTYYDVSLVDSEGKLWAGNRSGAIVNYHLDTKETTTVHNFSYILTANFPIPKFIEDEGKIWSYTESIGLGYGQIYSFDLDGSNLSIAHQFNQIEGSNPVGGLFRHNDFFYGMTREGGILGKGVMFRLNTNGTDFTVLHNFNGSDQNFPHTAHFLRVNQKPTINPQDDLLVLEDAEQYDLPLANVFFDTEDKFALTYEVQHNEALISSSENAGILSFTFAANQFGSELVTLTATDTDGRSATTSFMIEVAPVADNISIDDTSLDIGSMVTLPIARNAVDGEEVSHIKISNITNGTLYLNDGTTEVSNGEFIPFSEGISGLQFMATAAGTGGFTAQGATGEGESYLGGAEVTPTITINKLTQTIDFAAIPQKTLGDAPFDLSATASSGLAVTFSSSNESVIMISANVATIVGTGTATITASQSGDDTYSAASADVEVIVQSPLSVGNVLDMKVYPNPAKDYLRVEIPDGRYSMQLLDVNGRVMNQTAIDGASQLEVQSLPTGVYFLKLTNSTEVTQTIRFVKSH